MPTYLFHCPDCGEVEIHQSIHDELPQVHDCGAALTRIYTSPLLSGRVRASDDRLNARLDADNQFAQDHPAYKRLRDNGVQPKSIDGAAHLEKHADEKLEVESGRLWGTRAVKEGTKISEDLGMV